jgi:butyrate kinase
MEGQRILAINPGSTSTKIAVFEEAKSIFTKNIKHTTEELQPFAKITDQFQFRKDIILKELQDASIDINTIKVIVGRGGLVKPIESGIYEVNGPMPVVVDELQDVARISGHPKIERISIFHALNQKAIARTHANSVGRKYEEMNIIVAHLGGGISVGAHLNGRVVDVNNALDGDGPFSPERSGSLPMGAFARMCFSGEVTLDQVKKMITGQGGFVAYLETNDAYEVEQRVKAGDEKAKLIHNALAYQVSKEIGSMATVLHGKVDAILLTGGIAYDKDFVDYVKEMTSFIAPVVVYPGEDEMKALAMNGLMVLRGEIYAKSYNG